jgi:hypothetical protein
MWHRTMRWLSSPQWQHELYPLPLCYFSSPSNLGVASDRHDRGTGLAVENSLE